MKRNAILVLLCCTAFTWFSCSEEDAAAGFTTTFGEGGEDVGNDTIFIDFGKRLPEDMTISFSVGGSAALDGDYLLSFPSVLTGYNSSAPATVTVKAGQSSLMALIQVLDDPFVEPSGEEILILISGVSDNDVSSRLQNSLYTYVIHDNDVPPDDGLQVDLSWYLGDGVRIGGANFDLYLIHHVTEGENNDITAYEFVDGVVSAGENGFESIKIGDEFPDEAYYLLIRYTEGAYDALLTLIMSHDGAYSRARGVIPQEYAGQDIFYGPITKNGSSYARVSTSPVLSNEHLVIGNR